MKENLQGQSSHPETPYWKRDFVGQAAHEMGVAVARFSVDPESVRKLQIPEGLRLTDKRVAEELGKIDIFDSNLNKLDLSTDQGVFNAGVAAHAKTLALIEATFDTKVKSRLAKFADDLLDSTSKVIAKIGGKRGLALTAGLATVLTAACQPAVLGPVLPDGGPIKPSATAALPTFTASPTETATLTPESTKTPEPTPDHAPTPGIDTPVGVGNGVTLLFTKAIVTDNYYNPEIENYHYNIHPGMGQTWLVIEGEYKGDINSRFGPGISPPLREHIYTEGYAGQKELGLLVGWEPSYTTHKFLFAVIINKKDKGPYILHNPTSGWQVPLSTLFDSTPYSTPTPKP